MSILETFYILFKGDSTDVKKAAADSQHAVQSLQDALTGNYNKIDSTVGKSNASFIALTRSALSFFSAGYAAMKVFNNIVETDKAVFQLGVTSKALNVNVSDLDAWGNAVKRNGGTTEGFQSSLKSLAHHFGTSSAIALKALPRLADAFHRLGNFRSQIYGKNLGLDEGTILLLQQGRREVEAQIARQKELGVVTKQDVEISTAYKHANEDLTNSFRGLYLTLGREVIPYITKFFNTLTPGVQYLTKHKDLITGAFIAIGGAAVLLAAPFIAANASVIALVSALGLLTAAFALVFEDFKRYNEGKSSVYGDIQRRNAKTNLFGWLRPPTKDALDQYLSIGRSLLLDADQNALNSFNSSSILNSRSSLQNSNINISEVTINTQATDAVGIAASFKQAIQDHYWQTNNFFANGEAR